MATVAGGALQSLNPATLEVVGTVPIASPPEVAEAVSEARLAQERWRKAPFRMRRALLAGVASATLKHADEIATTVTDETGKPLAESYLTELFVAVEQVCWTAANAEPVLRPERLRMPQLLLKHKRSWLLYEPLGAVAVVTPWNFPFGIPLGQTVAAVAAGNAVLVKPSELAPLTGDWVRRVFEEAGAPPGLVRVLHGTGDVGAGLASARGIGKVFFTGSVETGRRVAAATAERLVPEALELGGKDPMLIFADADFERAVEGALWGSFVNCGQVCSGIERIYVERSRYEDFVAALGVCARELCVGRGDDPDVDLGPVITEQQREQVEALVTDATERGVEIRSGGGRPAVGLPGWFHEPTVLTGVPPDSRIRAEEIFSPVVTVEPFDREEQAVHLANDSRFGLGASVWTRDPARVRRVARRLETGSVWANDVMYSYYAGQAAWGGCKDSGSGRTHSKHGLYACTRVKYVAAGSGRIRQPWWYPYDADVLDGLRGSLAALYECGLTARASAVWRHRRGLIRLGRRYLG